MRDGTMTIEREYYAPWPTATSALRATGVSATFDLHNIAALRCASGLELTSAARTLFDAQERPLLGKIKALEVV